MDLLENQYDSNSSKTIILWKNEEQPNKNNTISNDMTYKIPRGLSENYLFMIMRTANDLVNRVIEDSQWIVQSSHLTTR